MFCVAKCRSSDRVRPCRGKWNCYTPEQQRRHQCLPGLTGLWQVSGRSRLSIQQMLELDLIYVERRSLLLDLKILWRTLPRRPAERHALRR